MAEFRVPSAFRSALNQLAEQRDDAIDELCGLLESNPEVLTSRHAALDQSSKLTKMGPDEGYKILEAIIPLMFFRASHPQPITVFLKDVTAALTTGEKEDSKLQPSVVPKFQKNLGRILALSAFTLKAKALSVGSDCQRLFSEAKILSDMRPVFGDNVSEPPLGIVLLHSLKIEFAEDGEEKEFFVHLDSRDLKDLQACLTRALEKDAVLRKHVEQSKLKIFETSE